MLLRLRQPILRVSLTWFSSQLFCLLPQPLHVGLAGDHVRVGRARGRFFLRVPRSRPATVLRKRDALSKHWPGPGILAPFSNRSVLSTKRPLHAGVDSRLLGADDGWHVVRALLPEHRVAEPELRGELARRPGVVEERGLLLRDGETARAGVVSAAVHRSSVAGGEAACAASFLRRHGSQSSNHLFLLREEWWWWFADLPSSSSILLLLLWHFVLK